MQDTGKILPLFVNTDRPFISDDPEKQIRPDEAAHSQGLSWEINANPEQGIGTNNSSQEGSNQYVLTPTRSNLIIPNELLPAGVNSTCGTFESPITKEFYQFVRNTLGNHSIWVINGDTGVISKVIIDPKLAFTEDQEGFISNERVAIRFVQDKDGNIIEKHLCWTNAKKWQGWINVIAAIATNGFDAAQFPYWALRPPHFDREELLEWPVRPPMIKPVVEVVENTEEDTGKLNRIVDKAIQFAISYKNTDGRPSTLSPYSLPLTVKSEEYLNNPNSIPKKAKLTLYAGSPLTEQCILYIRVAGEKNTLDSLAVWGDWQLYDTIDKFDTPADGDYWLRQNPWNGRNYDTVFNTFEYIFDFSKVTKFVSPNDVLRIQNSMPQISKALSDMDDNLLLINNRYGYDNFSKTLLDKLTAVVKEKTVQTCARPMRTIYLYAYIGQCGSNFAYTSQVGYTSAADTTVRFGGLRMNSSGGAASVNIDEAKFFQLDFADRDAFRCYLKGTPYYADGEWYIVKSDNTMEAVGAMYDFNNNDVKINVQTIFEAGSYFMCRFKLTVPAGRYIATLGRHNVASNADYRGQSTYIYGIANSRVKSTTGLGGRVLVSIKPNSVVSYSKEMEIDCTTGNVDVWGNNADLFYVYCPYNQGIGGNGKYRFIEGYFKESATNPLPVEMFPYYLQNFAADDWGKFTDKNGFYWAFTKVAQADQRSIEFVAKVNCVFPTQFVIPTSQTGIGWKQNAVAYLASHTGTGQVGGCNRVVCRGKITNLAGTVNYSNIAISIKDGNTVYTDTNGEFTLVVHNGDNTLRTSNVYVNAGGNYIISMLNCGFVPILNFSEALSPCVNCNERIYPVRFDLGVQIQSFTQTSLKQQGKYNVGLCGADLAGRITSICPFKELEVSSFLRRNNVNATYIQMQILSALNIFAENPDIKWVAPYVSKNTNAKRNFQWVGDRMVYLDTNGNVVTDISSAAFAKIIIDSLYNANVASNFTLLASYQFVKGDRLIFLDDGDGNLFNTATFGDPVNIEILGTNYNQAAINAGLQLPQTNTVLDNNTITAQNEIGLIVRYDARLERLKDKTGYWVEIYTPTKSDDNIPFFEIAGFYPVITGEIAQFAGYDNGVPVYNFPSSIDLEFWDTYYLQRNINGKFFNHPFESPNVTDTWGANVTSGGRLNVEDKNAAQYWDGGDVARSDSFSSLFNGLATFRNENRKSYGVYPYGEILAAITRRNVIMFICTNDWFVVEFNAPYTKVRDGNLVVTNLDENLSLPRPKDGPMFGIAARDIAAIVADDDLVFWYDTQNTAIVKSNWGSAIDITEASEGERGGMQSYLNAKTGFINDWNQNHDHNEKFDVIAGIDAERGNLYFTFRPRRLNSTNPLAFVNRRRTWDVGYQETLVYSVQYRGWLSCQNFTPEAYGRLRGGWANSEFLSFVSGIAYRHNNTPVTSFLNFYGVQCEPVLSAVVNKKQDDVKILQAIKQHIEGSQMFIDLIFESQLNSFSYIPANLWKEKEGNFYAAVLRDMASFPNPDPDQLFRSLLFDGKRCYGEFIYCRFVQKFEDLGKYFQLNDIDYLFSNSFTTKP